MSVSSPASPAAKRRLRRPRMCGPGPGWFRGEASRPLRRPVVRCLPCKTASDRRASLLVCAPDRSSQCGAAAMDNIDRHKGWRAHCVSGASTNRSVKAIWLRDRTSALERIGPAPAPALRGKGRCFRSSGYRASWLGGVECCVHEKDIITERIAMQRHPMGAGGDRGGCGNRGRVK